MTHPEQTYLPADTEQGSDIAVTEQKFQQLDLQGIGLQPSDFQEVLTAHKELSDINHNAVAEYGKNIASKTSSYTDELLNLVQNKDLDATGQKLNQVVQVAQQLNTSSILNKSKSSGFFGSILSKFKGAKQSFDQHFNTTKEQIDALVKEIESSQNGLKARVSTLDKMFDGVQDEYKQLGIYVAAGKIKEQEIQQQIAVLTGQEQDQSTTQKIYDLNHLSNNLEKRVSDLQVLQQSAMQTLPMIRIIQSNNLMLVDKFYAIKNITLPAWKNQISLAISLQEQKNSVQLANTIDDATNDLLKRNADLLHQNSVDTARANQRSVIDIETLEHVQNTLIKTVNDVIQIQKEGM
ncbi:MAG: toxic anion resistance protein, partial [Acinetobacter sp.]